MGWIGSQHQGIGGAAVGSGCHQRHSVIACIDVDSLTQFGRGRRAEIDWLGLVETLRMDGVTYSIAVQNWPWPAMSVQLLASLNVQAFSCGTNADSTIAELAALAANDNKPQKIVSVSSDCGLAQRLAGIAAAHGSQVAFYVRSALLGRRMRELAAERTVRTIDAFLRLARTWRV